MTDTFSIDACEEAFVRDFCPYKGSPDPLVVWRAAWNAAMAAKPAPARPMPASFPGAARGLADGLARIAEKCRPGYMVSKTVRAQLDEAATVAHAISTLANDQS